MRGAVTILICATTLILGDARHYDKCLNADIFGKLLPHEKCNRFYQCVGGKLVAQRCAAELRFDIETQQCDWKDRVECGDRNDDESEELQDDEPENNIVNDDPRLAPIICAAEGSDGILVAHEDCSKYYICSNGKNVGMPCPKNLLYNPIKEQCDWPQNVKCPVVETDPEVIVDDDSNEGNYDPSRVREICAAADSDGVLVAHEYCNKFYKCSSRIPWTLRCPPLLLYNPRKEQCDWPKNVNCRDRIIPDDDAGNDDYSVGNSPGNSDPNEAPAICAAEGSDGVLVAHEYCNKFYKCSLGVPVPLQCQLNLLYNPSNEQCDWPENVDCNGRIN